MYLLLLKYQFNYYRLSYIFDSITVDVYLKIGSDGIFLHEINMRIENLYRKINKN